MVGIDEVGRGACAGPVVVGACRITDEAGLIHALSQARLYPLKDSKKVSARTRERVVSLVAPYCETAVGEASVLEITSDGIVGALTSAATRALSVVLGDETEAIAADYGLQHRHNNPTEWFVKGDERILVITIASHVAKVYRDGLLRALAETYPGYGFERNAGYFTAEHQEAVARQGTCAEHRPFGSLKQT